MAGTTVLHLNGRSDRLRVVTLTVNNACNLQCPHCYLQYDAVDSFVAQHVVDSVCDAEFSHVAIVGKEPLLNRDAARRCQDLVVQCTRRGKTVSLITNGHGLRNLSPEGLANLAWIDVSFDGGPESYASYRRASYQRLKWHLHWLDQFGYRRVNALHTLSDLNLDRVDDMVAVENDFPFDRVVFSPYVATFNQGHNPVSAISLEHLFGALAASSTFMESSRTMILLGVHAFKHAGIDTPAILNRLETEGLLPKAFLVEDDPLDLGILRVTYDGLVLTPYESLHTAKYKELGRPLVDGRHLNQLFHDLCLVARA